MAQALDAIAQEMRQAQDDVRQVPLLTATHAGFSLEHAYAVADRVYRARLAAGAQPRGRKIGFTNSAIWPQYGVHQPIWGHVYAHTLRGPGVRTLDLQAAHFAEPRLEPEIAFGLRTAPRAGVSLRDLAACIEWVAPAFEVVQSHFAHWKFQVADTVADGGLHGALLVGDPVPLASLGPDAGLALASIEIDLLRDGQLVEVGRGANVLGSPLAALAHLVDVLAAQPALPPLRAGEIVTTGTVTAAYPVQAGETWTSRPRHPALQPLTLRFT